ncbi:MAG: ABC transporter substrate-binding protein [Deltaproteobacteria bacterium]|nr:ABC transporter substrate-binding protein [Candidatus Zymogenaceae bacterium]
MEKKSFNPRIHELIDQFKAGKLSRREFVRYAALLGVSAAVAPSLIGCAPETGGPKTKPSELTRGGVLRVAAPVHKVTHPAQFTWAVPSNQMRQVGEYLTWTDGENITRPYLLENWEASEDLLTWTLNLRQGITFNNGDEFNADDVVFTMNEWLNKDVGSSLLGMVGAYLSPTGIEKVGDYQVILHLDQPEIGVPEHLFHYPALVLNHRTFEGDFIKAPHGTGPYTIETYSEGELCRLVRRTDYWQAGADGESLPYMDGMEFIDMGTEMSPQVAALQSGEIDMIDFSDSPRPDVYETLKDDERAKIIPASTAQVAVLRMRVDMDPWTDNNVRMALKLCQNREKILKLAYFDQGLLGQDFHVYPYHPEYCDKPIPEYDPEKAKALLEEAGYSDGLEINLAVGNGWPAMVRYAEILKEDAAPAGFNVNIVTMPNSQYWEKWTEVDLGITSWTHRPLGTMVLNLAYTVDDEGNPVPWNETRWSDEEFSELLTEANGTLDVDRRRKIFCELERIQWERGSVGISFWRNVWFVTGTQVMDVQAHPTLYMLFNEVWLQQEEAAEEV